MTAIRQACVPLIAIIAQIWSSGSAFGQDATREILSPLPPPQVMEIQNQFRADGWSVTPDKLTGYLRNARRLKTAKPAIIRDEKKARQKAVRFVLKHRKSWGLSQADHDSLNVTAKLSDDRKQLKVEFKSPKRVPYPGYEDIKEFGYTPHLYVTVTSSGVSSVTNRTSKLPRLTQLNKHPSHPSDAAIVRNQVIGLELVYSDMAGRPVNVGKIGVGHIVGVERVVHIGSSPGNRDGKLARLSWRFEIKIEHLQWYIFVDAHTAKLIVVQQMFQT